MIERQKALSGAVFAGEIILTFISAPPLSLAFRRRLRRALLAALGASGASAASSASNPCSYSPGRSQIAKRIPTRIMLG